ncbi:hypothetical protein QW131_30050 [Roseibium salinum]|nr:hypothetical protein [Roseibium salinum]
MRRLKKLDHLLGELRARIFEPLPDPVSLEFRRARPDERAQVVAEARGDWQAAGPDLLWGEPGGYFWFAGPALTPPEAEGRRLFLHIDAQFGSTMGRSDPQCLVRVDGRIAQGADGNHRELLLSEKCGARTALRYPD